MWTHLLKTKLYHPFILSKLSEGIGYGLAWDKMIICPILCNIYAKDIPRIFLVIFMISPHNPKDHKDSTASSRWTWRLATGRARTTKNGTDRQTDKEHWGKKDVSKHSRGASVIYQKQNNCHNLKAAPRIQDGIGTKSSTSCALQQEDDCSKRRESWKDFKGFFPFRMSAKWRNDIEEGGRRRWGKWNFSHLK